MDVTAGSRWRSAVCSTQVIVVRAPSEPVDLRCGGHPMVPRDARPPRGLALAPGQGGGTATGKRFVHEPTNLELLCTHAGAGSLTIGDQPLARKEAKPLPSSD